MHALKRTRWEIEYHEVVDSTQELLAQRAQGACAGRQVVVAAEQRHGRGRSGRYWHSPRGGLWFSLSLVLDGPPQPFFCMLLALAARDAVEAELGEAGTQLRLKWPNDLMLRERKWGGVLAEARTQGRGTLLLCGAGLNLDIPAEKLPALPAITSIRGELGHSPTPREVLPVLLQRFDELLDLDARRGRSFSLDQVSHVLDTLGRRIRWRDTAGGDFHEGTAHRLQEDGTLQVRLDDGSTVELRAAEIQHLRDASP